MNTLHCDKFWAWIFAVLSRPFWKWETGRNFSMSVINSGHHNLPTYEISLKSNNAEFVRYCGGHFENGELEIVRCRESIQDIIIYLHVKFRWNRTMLNLWGIVAAILKMVTGRNFSVSGINLGHHNLPTYEMSLKSDNAEFVQYCGGHFENGDR